jgi:DNA-binding NarL/FixJ family response regulator
MSDDCSEQTPNAEPPEVAVLVADDQQEFLDAARQLVRATPGFTLAALTSSAEEAVTLVGELEPQIVLMDARMPGIGGIEAARRIALGQTRTVVVLISIDDLDSLPRSARSCGAAAIVKKIDLRPATLRELWDEHQSP